MRRRITLCMLYLRKGQELDSRRTRIEVRIRRLVVGHGQQIVHGDAQGYGDPSDGSQVRRPDIVGPVVGDGTSDASMRQFPFEPLVERFAGAWA